MVRTYRRLRRRFASARAAWSDIGRATGAGAGDVVGKAHTRSHWVFRVRVGRRRRR